MSDTDKAELENAETQAIDLGSIEKKKPEIAKFCAVYDGMFVTGAYDDTDGPSRPKVGAKLQKTETALSDETLILSFEQWGNFIAKNNYNMVKFTFVPATVKTMIILDIPED